MATKKNEIAILRQSDVSAFVEGYGAIPGDHVFEGLKAVYLYGMAVTEGRAEEARKIAYDAREHISGLWRRLKEGESAQKQLKPLIETICADVPMADYFKWQEGSKRTAKKILDLPELWKRLEAEGVTFEAFLARCEIKFDDAVELSGKHETAFLEQWGDIAEVSTTQAKAVLKAL